MEPKLEKRNEAGGERAVEKPLRGKVHTTDFSRSLGNPIQVVSKNREEPSIKDGGYDRGRSQGLSRTLGLSPKTEQKFYFAVNCEYR